MQILKKERLYKYPLLGHKTDIKMTFINHSARSSYTSQKPDPHIKSLFKKNFLNANYLHHMQSIHTT